MCLCSACVSQYTCACVCLVGWLFTFLFFGLCLCKSICIRNMHACAAPRSPPILSLRSPCAPLTAQRYFLMSRHWQHKKGLSFCSEWGYWGRLRVHTGPDAMMHEVIVALKKKVPWMLAYLDDLRMLSGGPSPLLW